jgi:hypothetical protein
MPLCGCRPDWSKAHFRCGEALMDLSRASEAVEHLQTALNLEPSLFVQRRLSEVKHASVERKVANRTIRD